MKPYHLAFLLAVFGLLFWVSNSSSDRRRPQAMEARPEVEKVAALTYSVVMEIEEENDIPVADILWFQKAAEVAIKHNIPWFNVLEEEITTTHVRGVIQLEKDPMKAEYDANEILSLHLTDDREE